VNSNSEIQGYSVYPMLHFCRKFPSGITLCLAKMCLIKSSASASALIVLWVGMNTTSLVNLPMMTRISMNPSEEDSYLIKSMEIDNQGLGGIGS